MSSSTNPAYQSEGAAQELQAVLDGIPISERKAQFDFAASLDDRFSDCDSEQLYLMQTLMAHPTSIQSKTGYHLEEEDDIQWAMQTSLADDHNRNASTKKDDDDDEEEKAYQALETSLLSVSTFNKDDKHVEGKAEQSAAVLIRSSNSAPKADQENKDEEFEAELAELRGRLQQLRS